VSRARIGSAELPYGRVTFAKVIAVRRAACHGLDSGSILELVRVMA